jgi:hypothetical protein
MISIYHEVHEEHEEKEKGKAGDVWGRYAARLTMGQIGRQVGGVMTILTSSYEYGGNVAGSPLDRILADIADVIPTEAQERSTGVE